MRIRTNRRIRKKQKNEKIRNNKEYEFLLDEITALITRKELEQIYKYATDE